MLVLCNVGRGSSLALAIEGKFFAARQNRPVVRVKIFRIKKPCHRIKRGTALVGSSSF
jgi:hypothetical protein